MFEALKLESRAAFCISTRESLPEKLILTILIVQRSSTVKVKGAQVPELIELSNVHHGERTHVVELKRTV